MKLLHVWKGGKRRKVMSDDKQFKDLRPHTIVSEDSLQRFTEFLGEVALQTYPEVESIVHTNITREQLQRVTQRFDLSPDARILDVGCGQGPALDALREMGFSATGITINEDDLSVCRDKGHDVRNMDQSFLDFPSASFDLVWARHCVEHSIMPFFTLSGFSRVLKPRGHLYLEVPAPGTACKHEENLNHYSVLTRNGWRSLLLRSGFSVEAENTVGLTTPAGPDEYFIFLCSVSEKMHRESHGRTNRDTLFLALSNSQNTGWGVCARNLRREFERSMSVVDLVASPPVGGATTVPGPLLTAIGDRNLAPVAGYRGSPTFGYTFVENTLGDQAKENSRIYEKIFCGSTWCRDRLDEAGIHNVEVLIQGVDTTLFRPTAPRPDDGMFIIFSGGKFEYRKGQDLVLKAVRILQEKYNDIVLINAWRNVWPETMKLMKVSPHINFELQEDTWTGQMEHLYRLNGIDGRRVLTLDLMAHESLPQLYGRTDLAIFPNRCEGGTNLVMMEYMACGRPVIATNFSGHQDIVNDNNALLLNHLTPSRLFQAENMIADWREPSIDEIVAHVEYAYHHRDVLRELGLRGALSMQQFTWSNAAETAGTVMGLARRSCGSDQA